METLKQNVGIDIAKDSFVATFSVLLKDLTFKHIATKSFNNTPKSLDKFYEWVKKYKNDFSEVHFTMEATGIYYENLAYYLFDKNQIIHVLLPVKAKKFAESSNIYRKMRTLTREKSQLIKERTRVKNQLHAEEHSAEPMKSTLKRNFLLGNA